MDIEVRGLLKRWGAVRVLDGLDLQVASGEFIALVGRSGAGKSTLLHLLAGIDAPESGSIRIGEVDITTLDEDARTQLRRHQLGLVFQNYNLVPSLSVADNLRLPLELVGRSSADAARQAAQLLDALGLSALAGRDPEQLSGGEQQRVAVARALAHAPALLLADEPTGSLDEANAAAVIGLLTQACRERGTTLVMATHSQEVMGHADRLLRIEEGRLVPA